MNDADLRYADLRIYQADNFTCYIQTNQIRIGCQCHSVASWLTFTDDQIADMNANASEFYKKHKAAILAIYETLPKKD